MLRLIDMTPSNRRSRMGGRLALAGLAAAATLAGLGTGSAAAQPSTVSGYSATQDAAAAAASATLVSGGWSYSACHAKGQAGLGRVYSWYECRPVGGSYQLWVVFDCTICRPAPDGIKESE